jgi:glycosyltransferase involved in cell wall biosynthesis
MEDVRLKILYVYSFTPTTSFTIVSKKHIEYMRKLGLARVDELSMNAFPWFKSLSRYVAVIHPFLFTWTKAVLLFEHALPDDRKHMVNSMIRELRSRYEKIVGVYVCDTDALSREAVKVLNEADVLVVPSEFCVGVYRRCGVSKPVYRVPHGVDPTWYATKSVWEDAPTVGMTPALIRLHQYKQRTGKKLLLWWFWHSWLRKGGPWVKAVYERLVRKRNDVKLVVKTNQFETSELIGLLSLGVVQIYGWLTEREKMALYDLADVTLMFSTGGAFELNGLESLARGVPAVAVDWGPWTEYIPPFLMIKRGERVKPLPNNNVHVGYGYAVDIEDAVAKIEDILDNYGEYRAKTDEWRWRVLYQQYRWDVVAIQLVSAISPTSFPP